MKTLSEIIEVVKAEKSLSIDSDVANLLGIKAKTFATAKIRNSIPFEEIASLCSKEGWSLNWLLSGEGPQYLKEKGGVVSQEGVHQGNIIKYVGLLPEEQGLIDKLIGILRGKNKDNRKAIIENVNAFYKTRNVESEEDDCGEGELKKTNAG